MFRITLLSVLILFGMQLRAADLDTPFEAMEGGELRLSQWAGQPVLVVNTASLCGYTPQYSGLQTLYETYRDRGLVILAVPSNDFRQELKDNAAVKDFCQVQFGLEFPVTEITHVKGAKAHPFYASLKREAGFVPRWNFNKVLIGPDGAVVGTYPSRVKPMSSQLRGDIEAALK
ncbi:glutathione peroxidase [Rhodalgimonas zhirmunskyi]|uniref:Glutathione peroxidase n=1 Tax=Rhodalgimonas zhirmunskyi TaxID=2964767 RepID=A0AAJ1UEQ1_9RHOB|nr:glutathione peroxidase [Rhodoalgimonas zhirmunskyi]MDQ2094901.1 glutathione peroxidase [Rhodoalgimonas zhirmunskyi]